MKPPAQIHTARLLLRKPRVSDARAVFEGYATDPEVTRYLIWPAHRSITETRDFLRRAQVMWKDGTEFTWAMTLSPDTTLIGMLALRITGCRIDFGYVCAKKFWNQGYTSEAVSAVVKWAMGEPGIYRIGAVCDTENSASMRVLEKAGLRYEGILHRWSVFPALGPVPRDCFSYALLK
jgi:[ribosomal protein S5]-alanine N-acetyltransferase